MKITTSISLFIIILITSSCSQMKSTTESSKQTDDSIYFKADGTEPFWGLTISEKEIILKTMEDTLIAPYQAPIKAMDSNVKLYKCNTDNLEMNIQITQNECTNDMSGKKSPYTVTINYKRKSELETKQIKGCGEYITDYRLNDIWVLETLNGKKVDITSFQEKLPQLEINSATNSFSGFAGCNGMGGNLFYEKGLLRFTNTITTMMYCGDNNKEREFLKALGSSTTYTIENNRLTLSNPSKELIIFRKID